MLRSTRSSDANSMSECPLRNNSTPVSSVRNPLLHCSLKLKFTRPALMRPWCCDSRLLECLLNFSELHQGDVPDHSFRLVPDSTGQPARSLLRSFPAYRVACILQRFVGRTVRSALSVLVSLSAGREKALLGYFLAPECSDIEVLATAISTSRHHAACCCSSF